MGNRPIVIRRTVVAAHLILTGYGHWAPNDPRGSGSTEVRKPDIGELGPIHLGRKRVQPPREELRRFHREFAERLVHPVIWFDENRRRVIAQGIEDVVRGRGYTAYACAVLRNHLHLVLRTHRDDSETMMELLAERTMIALQDATLVPRDHPVWSERPYKVYLKTRDEVLGRVAYVERNPIKEGLAKQVYPFVVPCLLK